MELRSPTTVSSDEIDVYVTRIENLKQRLLNINEKVILLERQELEDQHRGVTGGDTSLDRECKIETNKQIYIERLNKKLIALNTKISQNRELRRTIDEMQQERCRYDEIYTKLEREVLCQTEQMSRVLDEGKKAMKARDKALSGIEVLNKQLEEGSDIFRLEQEELSVLEEKFRKEDAMVPSRRRTQAQERRATQKTKRQDEDEESQNDNEMEEYDDEKALDDALARVLELTGKKVEDVDVIIHAIESSRDGRFALFDRIGELEAEAASNESKLSDMEKELRRLLRQGMNNDSLKTKEQREDRMKQSQIESQIDDIESRYQAKVDTWNRVRSKVMKVYEELQLDMPNDVMIRSADDGVTENNVLKYLGAIERKASEILAAIQEEDDDYNNDDGQDEKHRASLVKKGEYGTSNLLLPSATVIGNEYNSQVDDDVRPFTMKELQQSLKENA